MELNRFSRIAFAGWIVLLIFTLAAFLSVSGVFPDITYQALAADLADAAFEANPVIEARVLLKSRELKAPCFSVHDKVTVSGAFCQFEMDTVFGPEMAASVELLKIRQKEVETICRVLRENSYGSDGDFYKLQSERLKNGRYLDNRIDTRPDTRPDLHKVPDTGVNGGTAISTGQISTGQSLSGATVVASGTPAMASLWRHAALSLGIDPYTSGRLAMEFLKETALARSDGTLGSDPVPKVMPGTAPNVLDFSAIDAKDPEALLKLRTLSPAELDSYGLDRLRAMGVEDGSARAFIAETGLSPTHKIFIVYCMGLLNGVGGLQNVLSPIHGVTGEARALFFVRVARMLAKYHREGATVKEILVAGELPAALDDAGNLVVMLPVDVFYYSDDNAHLLDGFLALAKGRGVKAVKLVISGKVTPMAERQIRSRGFTLLDEVPTDKEASRRP